MKRIVFSILTIAFVISLMACSNTNNSNTTSASSETTATSSNYSPDVKEYKSNKLTDSEIEEMVADKLYNTVGWEFDTADPDSCKFEINKIERKNGIIYVYGELILYDKYGKLTTGWKDGSGTAFPTFEIGIYESTKSVSSCNIYY